MHLEFAKWVFARDSRLGFSSYFSAENLQRQKDMFTPSPKLQQSPSHAPTPTPVNGRTLLLSLNVSVIFRCILTFCVMLHEQIHGLLPDVFLHCYNSVFYDRLQVLLRVCE